MGKRNKKMVIDLTKMFTDNCPQNELHKRMLSFAIPVISIADPKVRGIMKEAGFILGVDTAPGSTCTSLFYGADMLHDIMKGRLAEWFPKQRVIIFSLDFRRDELEYLCAAVQHLRGRCCYNEN